MKSINIKVETTRILDTDKEYNEFMKLKAKFDKAQDKVLTHLQVLEKALILKSKLKTQLNSYFD